MLCTWKCTPSDCRAAVTMRSRIRSGGTVNLSCLVAFSPSSTTSKSLILGLGFRKFHPQNGRILLKLTVPEEYPPDGDGFATVKHSYSVK